MNSLSGVLICFRQENVAAMCDIEQMFHSFHVAPEHQNFLRFLWFKDNDPTKEVIDNKMTVYLAVWKRAQSRHRHLWPKEDSRRRRGEVWKSNKRFRPQKLLCR